VAVEHATASLALQGWQTGYSRSDEDQADRVGLRYMHEAGFDVAVAARVWARIRDKYGAASRGSMLFDSNHSRATERLQSIERELSVNYR
jgi:predicted Zn-dependent protease